ncbi:hypothetical protein RM717_31920 [Streptomyces griseus]|uniref:Uncharacterized protein n=1 Tax=Streptomyces stephensoniae TaxID=3375367 RepID=A0ABU2WCT0_9ACTN|nr:hypothetical protein [Streptomyces griseus]MDT0495106.1 hypothetical protein [Streptomyces griseus]MDT0523216.1 hypothetical protein [Streptomyces sp. DSM 41633]
MSIARKLGVAAAAVTLLGVSNAPAFAAGTGEVGTQAVPSCVGVEIFTHTFTREAVVMNNCSSSQRVKVLWAYAADSSCMIIPAKSARSDTAVKPNRFDGLVSC